MRASLALLLLTLAILAGCAAPALRGTGDLGVVIERASGSVQILDTTHRTSLAKIDGLGDLSHASVSYSRDGRYAYVFGRDGGRQRQRDDRQQCCDAMFHRIPPRNDVNGRTVRITGSAARAFRPCGRRC